MTLSLCRASLADATIDTMPRRGITVISQQRWRADDLAPFADIRLDLGLDTSAAADPRTVLWCPGAWAAAAVSRHHQLQLASAGPTWLDELPLSVTGRRVVTSCTQELYRAGRRRGWAAFTKLPETKHELFTAKVRTHAELVSDLEKLPADEPVQVQDKVVFTDEVRCWLRDGSVVAHAAYFADVPREDWPTDPAHAAPAATWLTRVLDSGTVPVPAAVTIDVGWCADPLTGDPGWRIVEANAAWSSDWCNAASHEVVATIAASQGGIPARWRWRPSPLLVARSVGLTWR